MKIRSLTILFGLAIVIVGEAEAHWKEGQKCVQNELGKGWHEDGTCTKEKCANGEPLKAHRCDDGLYCCKDIKEGHNCTSSTGIKGVCSRASCGPRQSLAGSNCYGLNCCRNDKEGHKCRGSNGVTGTCTSTKCKDGEPLEGNNCEGLYCCEKRKEGKSCTSSDGIKGTCSRAECSNQYLKGSNCDGIYCCSHKNEGKKCQGSNGVHGICTSKRCADGAYLEGSKCEGLFCCSKHGQPCSSSDGYYGTCNGNGCKTEYLKGSDCGGIACCKTDRYHQDCKNETIGRYGVCIPSECYGWGLKYLIAGNDCNGMYCCEKWMKDAPCWGPKGEAGTCREHGCEYGYLEGSKCNGLFCCKDLTYDEWEKRQGK